MMIFVPLSQIDDNPFQKRQIYDDIEELAADILNHRQARPDTLGLQQVPNGRLLMRNSRYPDGLVLDSEQIAKFGVDKHLINDDAMRVQLEFGHRRLRAFQHLAQSHEDYAYMPVFIRPLTDDQMLDGVWSENRQRRDLSAVEEAELLRDKLERLQANGSGSQREVAEAWGLARPTVANRLRLLELPAEIQQANREGKLSERQCLALATVVKIEEVLDTTLVWSGKNSYYGLPPKPADYIKAAIKEGKTSDEIRAYSERALRHAGKDLPKPIANYDFAPLGDGDGKLHQYTCRGCRCRVNDTCLKKSCLEVKKELYGQEAARRAAEELDLPYSNIPAHFAPYIGWKGNDDREKLRIVYRTGVSDKVVVGFWLDNGTALRPLHDGDSDSMWENDGKGLVVLGHKTPIDRELLAHAHAALTDAAGAEIEIEDIPDDFEIDEWEKEAGKIMQRVNKRGKAAVLDRLSYELADATTIQALVCSVDDDWLDTEAFSKKFRDFLWNKGSGISYFYTQTDEIEALGVMLDRAEIGRAVLWESDAERLSAAAMFVLCWWYGRRDWSGSHQQKEAQVKLRALREEFDNHRHNTDLATWSYELDRAWRDVQAKLAEEEAETAVEEEETAICQHCGKREANVTGEPYCGKCWQGELTDHLYCPECKALSTIAKTKSNEESQECWSCKVETLKGQWLKNRFTGELAETTQ